jgi:putative FmdB family regulatory protein
MTYEYACEACGYEWEAEQSISEKPLKKCVKCGKSKAKRLVSGGTGFLLKGGGWYADGYGSKGGSSSKSSSDGDGGGASTTTGTSTSGDSETKSTSGDSETKSKPSKGKKSDKTAA